MNEAPQKWKSLLAMAEFWYNSYHHSSLGCCHFKALYGYEPSMHILPNPADIAQPSVAEWVQEREGYNDIPKQNLAAAQNRFKNQADRHRTDRQFQVGESLPEAAALCAELGCQPSISKAIIQVLRPLYNC